MVVQFLVFLTLSTLICRGTDISKCFSESLGIRDNESRLYISQKGRKHTFGDVRPGKISISLRIWSESSLGAFKIAEDASDMCAQLRLFRSAWRPESSLGVFWIVEDARFLHADKEDSDKTAHMLEDTFSNEYPQSMYWAEIWKNSRIFIWKLSVFGGEIFSIFE